MKDKQSYEQGPITSLTPELMEGYANHSLPPELMQKVKEFLDKNPFESEAMEGLKSQSVDLTEEIQDLKGQLSRKLNSENDRSYFWPAAAVSLLAVSGVLFYFLMPAQADKIALNQGTKEVKTEQLEAVPETAVANDVIPAPARDIKEETEIIEVPDEEEIEEQIEVNLDVESTAPVINNLTGEIQPNKIDLANETTLQSVQTEALTIDNPVKEQQFTIQEGIKVDDRSKAKKATTAAARPQIARARNQPARLPLAEAPDEIMKYLKQHTKYPETAQARGVQGKVVVTFIVNEAGGLENFEIVQELGFGCDEEAVKALKQGPSWKPVVINGIPVKSRGHIEVAFPPQKL